MKVSTANKQLVKIDEPAKTQAKMLENGASVSGRWSAVQRIRLPHKLGQPLSSGGGGDGSHIDKVS